MSGAATWDSGGHARAARRRLDPPRPEGAAARPPRRRPATGHDRRPRPPHRLRRPPARRIGSGARPSTDVDELGRWFHESADSGSLERYLETFAHTVAVMQTVEGLHRVARECALDLAADGVVYAEIRYAPEQHLEGGLSLDAVVEVVHAGFREGCAEAA